MNLTRDLEMGFKTAKPMDEASPFTFLDLRAQFRGIRDEVEAAIRLVMESQHFILGPEVESLEDEIAEFVGCRFAIACASGSDALLLALMALGIGPGDEVVTASRFCACTAAERNIVTSFSE